MEEISNDFQKKIGKIPKHLESVPKEMEPFQKNWKIPNILELDLNHFQKSRKNSKIFGINSKRIGIISKKVGKIPKYLESFPKELE